MPDLLQDVDGLGAQFLLVLHAVGAQALFNLPADGVHRVQHRIGLLEHHRGLGTTHFAQLFAAQGEHVQRIGAIALGQVDGTGGGGRLRQQLDDGARGHGLAGTGFADHADHGLARNGEVHVLNGLDGAGVGHEGDGQVLDIGEILVVFAHLSLLAFRLALAGPFGGDDGRVMVGDGGRPGRRSRRVRQSPRCVRSASRLGRRTCLRSIRPLRRRTCGRADAGRPDR